MNARPNRSSPAARDWGALRIAGLYAVVGGLWLTFSDLLTVRALNIFMGLVYVMMTALLLYGLIRQHAAARLEGEARYRLLTENMVDVVWLLDPVTLRFRYVSPSVERLRGYTVAEVLAQPIEQVLTAASLNLLRTTLPERLRAFRAGDPAAVTQRRDLEHLRKDGSTVWTEVVSTLMVNPQGGINVLGVSRDITERHRAEEQLRDSEAKYKRVIETAAEGIWILDADDRTTFINAQGAAILGHTVQDMLGRTPAQFVFAEDVEFSQHELAHNRQGESMSKEYRMQRKDGAAIWIHASTSPILDAEQRYAGALSMFTDITGRKLAADALQVSEARYRSLFESSLVGIMLTHPDGRVYAANLEACRLLGRTEDELCQMGRDGIVNLADPRLAQALAERQRLGKFRGELTYVRADGAVFPVDVFSSIYTDRAGNFGAAIFFYDFTARKQAEEALRASQANLMALIENTDARIWSVDDRYRLIVGNSFFGRYVEQALGRELRVGECVLDDRFSPEARREWQAYYDRALRGESFNVETNTIFAATPRQIEYRLNPIRTRAGEVTGVTVFERDITERKRAEHEHAALLQEVEHARAQLQALSRQLIEVQENERRTLARELHDEVGQVMSAVKTNLETIQIEPDLATLGERLDESIDIVDRALDQIRTLALNLRPSILDDFGLVPTLEWYLKRQTKTAHLKITFHPDMPEMRFAPTIETTGFRFVQGALTNVERHAQATEVQIGLRLVTTDQIPDILELVVRDNGVGFDVPAALARARRGESLGLLGLQERVRLVGGETFIESAPGRGCEIRIRLPIHAEG